MQDEEIALLGNNPVCYRHRLPAIFGSVFNVLDVNLNRAFSCIWLTSTGTKMRQDIAVSCRMGRGLKIFLPREFKWQWLVVWVAGQRWRWRWNSSWCYRFGPAPEFLDSCQSPGSVSFRQPIRGVVTARSPSLIPRRTHACFESLSANLGWSSWGSSKSQQSTRDLFVLPLSLAADSMLPRPFVPQPTSIASLAFSCLPFAASTCDLKYITGYKSILDAVGCVDRQGNFVDPLRSIEICLID